MCVPVLIKDMDFQRHMSLSLFMFNDLGREVIVCFVDKWWNC